MEANLEGVSFNRETSSKGAKGLETHLIGKGVAYILPFIYSLVTGGSRRAWMSRILLF